MAKQIQPESDERESLPSCSCEVSFSSVQEEASNNALQERVVISRSDKPSPVTPSTSSVNFSKLLLNFIISVFTSPFDKLGFWFKSLIIIA